MYVGIGVGLGVSSPGPTTHTNGLTPVHLTLFTVRPETFTSRLLSDPFSQVHQSQKQKSAGIAERMNKNEWKNQDHFLGPAYPLRTPRTKLSTKNDPMMISVTK